MSRSFTLDDHPALAGAMGPLFTDLQERTLALSPLVSMSIFKGYIAFVRTGHFVDDLPREAFLRVLLCMPFEAVRDPRGLCRDIAGTFGPFEAEFRLSSPEDLDYCVALVKQAYDRDG